MIVFFLAKKENIVVPNAVDKSRTGAFQSRDQTLSFFFRPKKRQSSWKWEYSIIMPSIGCTVIDQNGDDYNLWGITQLRPCNRLYWIVSNFAKYCAHKKRVCAKDLRNSFRKCVKWRIKRKIYYNQILMTIY